MFAKLAFKNIKRSIKDYAIYFFTLVLGVAIFYVFNSLDSQTVMLEVGSSTKEIINLMINILSGVSIFVSVILGALIIFASRFLIKRRSKEFGLYLTLGMGKRKISLILLLETFFIGLISLAVGLLLGVLLSQFTSVLVANMFEANLTKFTFIFSVSACVKTLIYFGIIYLIVMIFNTVNISRQKLINLLSSSRRGEKIKLKNPWVCTVVFLLASAALGWTYYMVTAGTQTPNFVDLILPILATGCIATFFLFWSLSGLLLRVFMSFKNLYYHKLNSFTLRQFSSKINTTVASMTLICLMLFVTICVLSSALSIRNAMMADLEKNLPADVEFEEQRSTDRDFYEAYLERGIDLRNILGETVKYETYYLPGLTFESTLGSTLSEVRTKYPSLSFYDSETVIKLSDYNRIAKLFGNPELSLADNEYAIVANYEIMAQVRNLALKNGEAIKVTDTILRPKYDECQYGAIRLSSTKTNSGIIVVPDSLNLANEKYTVSRTLAKYAEGADRNAADQQLQDLSWIAYDDDSYFVSVTTRQSIIDNNVGLSALVTFIGLYLGLIFLISSAAILALKELSESSDNREKFSMLRKIGASEKMLNSALFWQIAIFFAFPLLIAVVHSIFGMIFCNIILESLGNMQIFGNILTAGAFLIFIYGGYFLITYFCSKNIIRERRL